MQKNLIPEIRKMLGLEAGEEFKIEGQKETFSYVFEDGMLKYFSDDDRSYRIEADTALFSRLVRGYLKIVRIPWRPKFNEKYWTFSYSYVFNKKLKTVVEVWREDAKDYALFKIGWVYRTQREAEEALPNAAEEMKVEYEYEKESKPLKQQS